MIGDVELTVLSDGHLTLHAVTVLSGCVLNPDFYTSGARKASQISAVTRPIGLSRRRIA